MTQGTLICVWGAAVELDDRDLIQAASLRREPGLDDPLAALRIAAADHDGPIALVDGHRMPAPGWLERLEAGFALDPDADAISALDLGDPLLSPCLPATDLPAETAAADAFCRLYSDRLFFPQRAVSRGLSLWRRAPNELSAAAGLDDLAAGSLRILTCDHVLSPGENRARPAAGPLDLLRYRLHRATAKADFDLTLARPDETATVLHVTHSWGGGTQRWISDLAESLDDRRHLILMSRGDSRGVDCGQVLELRIGSPTAPPVRVWTMPSSIRSVDTRSREHEAVVQVILREWGVGQVIVSSVIGHSISVLETGLPTLVVCHDYFPLWPNLDVAFEADEAPFDLARLEGPDRHRKWFRDLAPERWQTLRDAWLAALARPEVRMAAPSRSVLRNLARLEPALGAADIALIPHGLRAFEDAQAIAGRGEERWRIVIPGRIGAGKGKDFVAALIRRYADRADFYLVGAGHDGHDFFGLAGAHVILQYEREALPGLLREIGPDFALLASTVSETFSYTLSELWSLGVPVVATRRGAFIERVEEGRTGTLIEPDPDAFGTLLGKLDHATLGAWREAIRDLSIDDIDAMGAAYRELLPRPDPAPQPASLAEPQFFSTYMLAGEDLAQLGALDVARQRVAAQEAELERRGAWGFRISRQLEERTQWAQRLDGELELARRSLDERSTALEERTAWARQLEQQSTRLERQSTRLERQLARLQRELDERTAWAMELKDLLAEEEHRRAAVEHQLAQSDANVADLGRRLEDMTAAREAALNDHREMTERFTEVVNSRSWWLTKPLRFAARLTRRTLDTVLMRGRRTASLAQRTKRSIEVRGVKGTVERIEQEIRRPKPTPTVTAAPELTADYRPLAFPAVANPQVSVVIPVHNHYHHTYACLKSLLETTVAASFEVVVVDDASSDETVTELPRIEGITHLQNVENLGFVGTCNRGAEASRGEYVVFLNNDTAVADGWLDALLETFETHPDAGLVGAKLVYPDGRLQEAGGIVFADGSGWNYGRFEDPDHPAYNFVREVDYCSGAAIMIRRELFQELGCFDQRYAPAYYEDTDLAFAVRDHGLKVYYQPASVVTHFEGITSGTDTSSGTKRYQVINQAKFLEKWAGALARQNPPGTSILRAREHGRMRRALIIDACTPEPDKDSGSVRMVHIMEILRELGYQVSFFADNRAWVEGYTADLQRLGVEAWHHPWIDHSPKFFEDAGDSFDVVILSRYYVATNYIELLRRHCRGARLLFDTVDLHFLRERRLAELEDDEKLAETATKTREQELGVAARCDVTLVVSPYEQTFLAEEAPDLDVAVVSNIHRVHGRRRTWADRANILFVGGYQHPPNIDAVQWFATEIFPHVRRELHDVVFHIVGSKATPDVRRLGDLDGVEFHGFVEDIEPFLDGCRIAVAPLRYGAGVKGKVNSSMSYGQPVVATTPAVEGMFVRPGEDVLVADEPEAFASQVVRAYRDEGVWNRLSDGGLENVQRYFSFEAAREAIRAAITSR